jgi:hypothetical protein
MQVLPWMCPWYEEGQKACWTLVATKMAVLNGMNLDESRLTEGLAPLGGVHVGAQDPFVVCFILVYSSET